VPSGRTGKRYNICFGEKSQAINNLAHNEMAAVVAPAIAHKQCSNHILT